MKKRVILLEVLCITILVGCGIGNSPDADTNDYDETNILQTFEESEEADRIENQNLDYQSYNGTWSENGLSHEEVLENGGTELQIKISADNEIQGVLFSQQGMSKRIAQIDHITGIIENGECRYDYEDDGWGNRGTLLIRFQEKQIRIEVLDFVLDEQNASEYGINGTYELIREKNPTEDSEKVNVENQESGINQFESYNSNWDEDRILQEIKNRSVYFNKSSFRSAVIDYMENVWEIRDISIYLDPLYETGSVYYTKADFKDVPSVIIHLAKNEIYARHGYIFLNEDLNNYFMGQLWYSPKLAAKEWDDSVFNEYEVMNLAVLSELDDYQK